MHLGRALPVLLAATLLLGVGPLVSSSTAQTVRDIAGRGACSTAGVEAISRQLAEAQMCIRPGAFVRFAPHPGITLTSSRVHPFAQASARDALHRAAARTPFSVNSAFRTVADQYVLYHSGGCGLAATPGRSNHQSGRAVDVQNYSAARSALQAQGCTWLGSRDPVHFDCPGSDQRADSIRAFQRLWNVNNPGDTIAEDGIYGPATESRLGRTPAGGFARGACDSTPEPPPPSGGRLLGAVYENPSIDRRVDGASVRVVGESLSATTGADGMWAFEVPDGTYTVEASKSGFTTARHTCTVAGGDTWCSVGLDAGSTEGAIRGVVFEDVGSGLADTTTRLEGASVVVTETGDRATSDATGSWALTLPAGTYTLAISKSGYAAGSRSCTVTTGGETWCSVGLALDAVAGVAQGVLFAGSNVEKRVIGATVRVVETGASLTSREGDGFFRFELPPGTYTLEASGDGILPANRTCEIGAGSVTWCSMSIEKDRSGSTSESVVFETVDGAEHGGGAPADADGAAAATYPGPAGSLTSGCSASGNASGSGLALLLALAFVRRRRQSRQ